MMYRVFAIKGGGGESVSFTTPYTKQYIGDTKKRCHYTPEVYSYCRSRMMYRVFAIKGGGGESVSFTTPYTKQYIGDTKKRCRLYKIGVDAGKAQIMANLRVMAEALVIVISQVALMQDMTGATSTVCFPSAWNLTKRLGVITG